MTRHFKLYNFRSLYLTSVSDPDPQGFVIFSGSGSVKKLTKADPEVKGKNTFYFFYFSDDSEQKNDFLKTFLRIIQNVKKTQQKLILPPGAGSRSVLVFGSDPDPLIKITDPTHR